MLQLSFTTCTVLLGIRQQSLHSATCNLQVSNFIQKAFERADPGYLPAFFCWWMAADLRMSQAAWAAYCPSLVNALCILRCIHLLVLLMRCIGLPQGFAVSKADN